MATDERGRSVLSAQAEILLVRLADKLDDDHGRLRVGDHTIAKWLGRPVGFVRKHRAGLIEHRLFIRVTPVVRYKASDWQLFPDEFAAAGDGEWGLEHFPGKSDVPYRDRRPKPWL